jgi:hypothetical protein
MSKLGTVGKRKHITLMISLERGMIRRLKSSYSQSVNGFIQHWIVNCLGHQETEDQL